MPGVSIKTSTRTGPVNLPAPLSARYFVVGQFDRGLTGTPVRVRSVAELEVAFGTRTTYSNAYDDLRCFFEEGGTEAVVVRVVGAAATKGTLSLPGAAAAPSLRADAASAGAWSTGVTVQVKAGTTAGTFALVVTGPITGYVETYDNLSTPADAVNATINSRYVRLTALGTVQPAVLAATALSTGTDDRASITGATMVAGLSAITPDWGTGAFSIPGYDAVTVGAGCIAWAKANRRIYLGAFAQGSTNTAMKTAAAPLVGADGEHGGLFGPWVRVPLPGGATKLIGPEGFVAAQRARTHLEQGPYAAPAGDVAQARFVVGLETEFNRADGDDLNEANVSLIRRIAGTIRLYGWRSLSTDTDNYRLLNGRDTLNTVAADAERLLERHVFKTIDGAGRRLASVAADLIGLVEPYRVAGGLYERYDPTTGDLIDKGYSVDVGPSVNTAAVLAQNSIAAVLALRVSPIGELVNLTIVKAGLTATV